MLKCSKGCPVACDFCIFYDFNGVKMKGGGKAYDGYGVCWNPRHPHRCDPGDYCDDFICFRVIEGDDN